MRKFLNKILHHQTQTINSAALVLAAASFISALLGLLRDRLLAGNFGVGDELDIYYAAFRLPDFISMVFIIGAISAAIIPIFSEHLTRSKEEAFRFLSNLLNVFFFCLILICLLLIIFAPQILSVIAPGFSAQKKEMTVLLTRIMFLSPIILGLSNILSAVLRVFQRFLISSLAPIMYNLGIIFGILFFVPFMGLPGLAWGVVLGAFLHLLIQIPAVFGMGFKYERILDFRHSGVRKVVWLTLPRSLGLAADQLNLIVVTAIASTLSAGSIAIFNLASSLSRPIQTFIGNSFSTAAFPSLSLAYSQKDKEKYLKIFSEAFYKIILFIIPISLVVFLFRDFFIKIIFKVGKFASGDVHLTAACLGMFAIGLFAQSLNLLLAKAFHAVQNTKLPAFSSILDMAITVGLSFLFLWLFSFSNIFRDVFVSLLAIKDLENIKIVALPLAISLSAVAQFLILLFFFRKKFFRKNQNGAESD